jgi:hypothetical protein
VTCVAENPLVKEFPDGRRPSAKAITRLVDRALIGVLVYGFARTSAALAMRVEDYFRQGKRW